MPDHSLRRRQIVTVLLLFGGYAALYFCRADLSVATPLLIEELKSRGVAQDEAMVRMGTIASLGVLSYAFGKLFLGGLGDFWGGRINFLIGLAGALVFTLLFARVAKLPTGGLPPPIFSFVALLPWQFFSGTLSQAIPSLASNSDLINKVYFPRQVIPLSSLLVAGADFLVATVLYLGMMVAYRVPLTWTALYAIPLLLILMVFASGLCLFFSGLNVFYRDIRYALPLVLQLWIYGVPVIYELEMIPQKYRTLYMLDPVAVVVDGFRRCLAQGRAPLLSDMLLGAASSLVVLGLGVLYFRWVEQAFADIV